MRPRHKEGGCDARHTFSLAPHFICRWVDSTVRMLHLFCLSLIRLQGCRVEGSELGGRRSGLVTDVTCWWYADHTDHLKQEVPLFSVLFKADRLVSLGLRQAPDPN